MYRPQASSGGGGSAPVGRAPVIRRDTVGTFEARLRWTARWRWLAPVLVVAALAVVVLAWTLLGRRGDAGVERTRAEALALVALDDVASVDDASARLAAVVNKRPKLRAAAADRALALVVRAAAYQEEAEALAAHVAAVREERERARREQPAGWEVQEHASGVEVSALEPEIRAREERTRALSSGAREQLVVLQAEIGETREVARALALLHAFSGEKERLQRILRVARESGARDPWIELADGWGDARDPDRAARERSLVKLGALAAAQPGLVRGRFLLARAELALGRRAEALATVEGVLATNPKHEGARRMRDELVAKAQATPPAPAAAPAAPPGKPPTQQRKLLPHRGPAPSPPAAVPGPAAEAAVEPPAAEPAADRPPAAPPAPPSAPAVAPPAVPPQAPPPAGPARRARPSVDPTGDLGSGG